MSSGYLSGSKPAWLALLKPTGLAKRTGYRCMLKPEIIEDLCVSVCKWDRAFRVPVLRVTRRSTYQLTSSLRLNEGGNEVAATSKLVCSGQWLQRQ